MRRAQSVLIYYTSTVDVDARASSAQLKAAGVPADDMDGESGQREPHVAGWRPQVRGGLRGQWRESVLVRLLARMRGAALGATRRMVATESVEPDTAWEARAANWENWGTATRAERG